MKLRMLKKAEELVAEIPEKQSFIDYCSPNDLDNSIVLAEKESLLLECSLIRKYHGNKYEKYGDILFVSHTSSKLWHFVTSLPLAFQKVFAGILASMVVTFLIYLWYVNTLLIIIGIPLIGIALVVWILHERGFFSQFQHDAKKMQIKHETNFNQQETYLNSDKHRKGPIILKEPSKISKDSVVVNIDELREEQTNTINVAKQEENRPAQLVEILSKSDSENEKSSSEEFEDMDFNELISEETNAINVAKQEENRPAQLVENSPKSDSENEKSSSEEFEDMDFNELISEENYKISLSSEDFELSDFSTSISDSDANDNTEESNFELLAI